MISLVVIKAQAIINIPKEGVEYIGTGVLTAIDKNKNIRIEDILSNESSINFQPSAKQSVGSNSSESVWLKFSVLNNTGQRAFIDFNPSLADSIVLYYLDDKQELHSSQTGLAFKFSERGIQHFCQNLELTGTQLNKPQTYYVRLATKMPINFFVRVGTEKAFGYSYSRQDTVWGLYMGVILFVVLIGSYITFFINRGKYVFFILYLLSMVGLMGFYNGKIHQIFFYDTPQYNTFSIILRYIPQIASVAFTISFLKLKNYLPQFYKVTLGILVLFIANIFYAFFNLQNSLYLLQLTGFPLLLFSLYIALRLHLKGNSVAIYYLIGWSLQPISVLIYSLANWGFISPSYHTIHFTYSTTILQAVLISMAFTRLLDLIATKEKEAQALFIKVLNEKQDNINKHNQELEHVVGELKREFALSLQREKEKEEKLIRNNKELQEFASIVSHDLRAPLRNINSFAQILIRKNHSKFDEKDQEYAQFILQGVKQSSQLIEDLLNYSRMEKNIGTPEIINLNDTVLQVLNNNKNYIGEKNASINVHLMPDIKAHKSLVVLVWQNLILNGIKYNTAECPEIEIGVTEINEHLTFFVRDNGIGIPLQYQEEIFRMFRRLHTNDQYEGTGIGLAFCKRVIEFYDGTIWFDSEMGTGTTFYFTLPKVSLNAAEPHVDSTTLKIIDVAA